MAAWLRIAFLLSATTLSACASTETEINISSSVETTMEMRLK